MKTVCQSIPANFYKNFNSIFVAFDRKQVINNKSWVFLFITYIFEEFFMTKNNAIKKEII